MLSVCVAYVCSVIENGIDMVGREFEKLDILQQKTAPHSVEVRTICTHALNCTALLYIYTSRLLPVQLRQGFLEHLRSVGVYQQMQNNLREAMVGTCIKA